MTRLLLIVAALAASLAGCGMWGAEEHRPRPVPAILYSPNGEPLTGGKLGKATCEAALAGWFNRVDGNHDGAVDHAEFMADAKAQFQAMDLDHDGYLTAAKLAQYRTPYEEARGLPVTAEDPVMSADRTLSFKVSLDDFLAQAEEVFAHLDRGRSGRLSLAQVQARCPPKEP